MQAYLGCLGRLFGRLIKGLVGCFSLVARDRETFVETTPFGLNFVVVIPLVVFQRGIVVFRAEGTLRTFVLFWFNCVARWMSFWLVLIRAAEFAKRALFSKIVAEWPAILFHFFKKSAYESKHCASVRVNGWATTEWHRRIRGHGEYCLLPRLDLITLRLLRI